MSTYSVSVSGKELGYFNSHMREHCLSRGLSLHISATQSSATLSHTILIPASFSQPLTVHRIHTLLLIAIEYVYKDLMKPKSVYFRGISSSASFSFDIYLNFSSRFPIIFYKLSQHTYRKTTILTLVPPRICLTWSIIYPKQSQYFPTHSHTSVSVLTTLAQLKIQTS
jgi:hypothetical protein